jgi:hypothetical protein
MQAHTAHAQDAPNKGFASVSLDELLREFEAWRAHKSNPSEPIPNALWHKIFSLTPTFSPNKLRSIFGVSPAQYHKKWDELRPDKVPLSSKPIEPPPQAPPHKAMHPLHQPLKLPSAMTMVVEFCRPDGQIMKIHTTTDHVQTLLNFFFSESYHAAHHSST